MVNNNDIKLANLKYERDYQNERMNELSFKLKLQKIALAVSIPLLLGVSAYCFSLGSIACFMPLALASGIAIIAMKEMPFESFMKMEAKKKRDKYTEEINELEENISKDNTIDNSMNIINKENSNYNTIEKDKAKKLVLTRKN